MEITFTLEEAELLMDVLEERHRDLFREISRTTHREFKVRLRKDEKLLESIIKKLHVAAPKQLSALPA